MKAVRNIWLSAVLLALGAVVLFSPAVVFAGYPMISDLQNVQIPANGQAGPIRFSIYDDKTAPSDLALTYQSNNTALVPADDDHITFGGQGASRTVTVTPVENGYGKATITVIVTDTDGEKNQDTFDVDVARP